jgi:hypothetical protein
VKKKYQPMNLKKAMTKMINEVKEKLYEQLNEFKEDTNHQMNLKIIQTKSCMK